MGGDQVRGLRVVGLEREEVVLVGGSLVVGVEQKVVRLGSQGMEWVSRGSFYGFIVRKVEFLYLFLGMFYVFCLRGGIFRVGLSLFFLQF